MSDFAIKVEELSKSYRLGTMKSGYGTIAESVTNAFRRDRANQRPDGTLWALRDVSFEVKPGETVGFVGRNGAGKSTMLKILSRIARPTSGHARLYGRVGSLLEVGTGFHGELTGAENIYMNGALLGLNRAEIRKRYDAIVEFSEVGDFLNTPVKRFSSGMVVRLAFAVAAHLEPEILLVDEVLAVGDIAFQRKCLGKISESASAGRTVLFVSHNMAVIQALCTRGIFLHHGVLMEDGPIGTAVEAYLRALEERAEALDLSQRQDRKGLQQIRVTQVSIGSGGGTLQTLTSGGEATFRFELSGLTRGVSCAFSIFDQFGHPVTRVSSEHAAPDDVWETQEQPHFICVIPELPLVAGRYRLDVAVRRGHQLQDEVEGAAYFDVVEGIVGGRPSSDRDSVGNVALAVRWHGPAVAAG